MFGKLVAGLLGGILVGAFAVPAIGMVALRFGVTLEGLIFALFGGCVLATSVLSLFSSRPARAWRLALLAAGTSALTLFVFHVLWSGSGAVERPAVVISFVAGVALFLVGLLVGRKAAA